MKIQGWDVSLNHGAFVELTDGKLTNLWYVTDVAGSANRDKKRGQRLPVYKQKSDRQHYALIRLAWWEAYFTRHLQFTKPDIVGLEDYALRQEQGAHQMGEVGGMARLRAYQAGVKLRLHDPTSVKLFGAHHGNAQKPDMEKAVAERWNLDFSKFNPETGDNRKTSEDLADAFVLAWMVWTEHLVRTGHQRVDGLHVKEVQVFNRVTKAYPTSLLSREWIAKED